MDPFPPFIRETLSESASARKMSHSLFTSALFTSGVVRCGNGSDVIEGLGTHAFQGSVPELYRESIRWRFFTSRCL